jgi:cobaltochelatase CobN
MADLGLVFACAGCCCGHPERGGPKPPPRLLKAAVKRAMKKSGLEGQVRLAFTDCLGPCSEANVVFLYLHGRPLWFRRMNYPELFSELFGYVDDAARGRARSLPTVLACHSFSWTGDGMGPAPPVDAGEREDCELAEKGESLT